MTTHALTHGPAADFPRLRLDVSLAGGETASFEQVFVGRPVRAEARGLVFEARPAEHDLVEVAVSAADGRPLDVDCVEVTLICPMLNFSKVVLPDTGREYLLKDKAMFLRSIPSGVTATDIGHPFVALLDQQRKTRFAFGLATFLRESSCRCTDPRLSARKAMRGGHDVLALTFRLPSEGWRYGRVDRIRETLFVGRNHPTWVHALRRYTDACKSLHVVRYPDCAAAREPTWCTWTAWCSDRMSEEAVLANAQAAKALGVSTLILDDGWFGPGLDTDDRPLNIGDYYPDPAKFRDLPGLIERLHKLDLKVLLWYAPTCVAETSNGFASLRNFLMEDASGPVPAPNGFYNLCPANPEARAHVRGEIQRMLRDYGCDGFKLDLFNTLPKTPCAARHPHTTASTIEGVHAMLREIWELVRRDDDAHLVELKQNYGNVLGAQYGSMVRAGDTAYDVDSNLLRCAYVQAYAPVVHNDYLACSVHDDAADISIMMIKQLAAGVPTFSMDLTKQPRPTLDVIGAWLAFYRATFSVWQKQRAPQNADLSVWEVSDGRTAIVTALFDAAEVSLPPAPIVFVLNGTGRSALYVRNSGSRPFRITRYTRLGEPAQSMERAIADGDRLSVPAGDYLRLELVKRDTP